MKETLELLKSGKQIERNITFVAIWNFIRDEKEDLVHVHCQTFHTLKKKGLLELVKGVDNNPDGWLNASEFYKLNMKSLGED